MIYDAVIIGAGHNGLVTACYLARAGMRVCVVEKNDWIGGAAARRSAASFIRASPTPTAPTSAACSGPRSCAIWNCRNTACRSCPTRAARC
ncbi:FAD-dependent oxidoreductase [Paracoccaceae bacterium Fryx2]|nr:FAD-dependent oxidoreductase [Paracoccaceae bacterium Fryx2]